MGIPSYYRTLADTVKGLVSDSKPSSADVLYFDFNCLIYHVARREGCIPYPGLLANNEYETLLLDDVVSYVVDVWRKAGSPKEVFLAVDGVVPLAKIKQQRMRRFKSAASSLQEESKWDTNAITPGTAFMEKLSEALKTLCLRRSGWSSSGAEEPGEGEHKIMAKLRSRSEITPVLIYGLDADLILLTMLNAKTAAFLMREKEKSDIFSFLDITLLQKTIGCESMDDLKDYIAGMSLLGNDFVPHSLTVKIRDDGHGFLLESLKEMHRKQYRLVENDIISRESLHFLFVKWSGEEESRLSHTCKKKLQMRGRVPDDEENQPIKWAVERELYGPLSLKREWRDIYHRLWLRCETKQDIDNVCSEYLTAQQWVLDYYLGKPVPVFWCFSRLLPPLWSDLVEATEHIQKEKSFIDLPPLLPPLLPQEQLAMVLPLQSWNLIRNKALRRLPSRHPQFWPSTFSYFSPGRRRFWECEPMIPMIPALVVKSAYVEE